MKDISPDFVRFVDDYVREVFTTGLAVKSILGSELSVTTFPYVLRDFVQAFQDACPVAMSFTEAMSNATVLMAKESVLKMYTKAMDKKISDCPRGIEPDEFQTFHKDTTKELEAQYAKTSILGSDDTRTNTWEEIRDQIKDLHTKYVVENNRRLEQALIAFANLAILGVSLFTLDRLSDWTCDWWLQTCKDLSSLMFLAYFVIFCYIGFFVWKLASNRGKMAAAASLSEMWKEMLRLCGVYSELASNIKLNDLQEFAKKSVKAISAAMSAVTSGGKDKKTESKKNK